jgi:syntaxin 5
MTKVPIQDRTNEFRSILVQASKRQNSRVTSQRQSLLSDKDRNDTTPKRRSDFSRKAGEISRQVAATSAKLGRLAELAGRKTLFDDRSVEINELTFVIKQDLSALDRSIKELQTLSSAQHPKPNAADQEGEHTRNVVLLLRQNLGNITTQFKDTLELRTKTIQATRSRTENFISSVSAASNPSSLNPSRTDSPLYQTPQQQQQQQTTGRKSPLYQPTNAAQSDILSLDPSSSSSALTRNAPASSQQLLLMEEGGSNTYIQARGEAIATIESTISELSGIFTQLAQLVSEQGEQITRIDDNVEDVVGNVEGAQRELLKYWSRVQGNRWLVAKMFGVLMVFFLLWVLIAG